MSKIFVVIAFLLVLLFVLMKVFSYSTCPSDPFAVIDTAVRSETDLEYELASFDESNSMLGLLTKGSCTYLFGVGEDHKGKVLDAISIDSSWKRQPQCSSSTSMKKCDENFENILTLESEGLTCVSRYKTDSDIISMSCSETY